MRYMTSFSTFAAEIRAIEEEDARSISIARTT